MKPNELIDNMVEKSKTEVKPTIPQKPAAPKPKAFTDYKGVEKTPYGHVYNFNGESITDLGAERASMKMPVEKGKNYGFTYTKGGDEVYADTFEDAYKALGGKIGESPKPKKSTVAKTSLKNKTNGGSYDLDNERSWGPVRYKNVNEAYADFEKYLGSGEPDEIDRFNNAAEQLDEYLEPLFANKEEKAKWDSVSQTGTGEQIIDMAKSIIERSQKPKVSAEPVYNENDSWESWADKMDQFVPEDWDTDGWDGNTRIYTAPNGDSVWVHAGGGVTVYPANFNGPNEIESYDNVTEYINNPKQRKVNIPQDVKDFTNKLYDGIVPQEQPKTDWHEKGFMLGRQNGLSDEESDELATLIYNFMKGKNK